MSSSRLSVAEVRAGRVRGVSFNGVNSFLGIPFGRIGADSGRFQAAVAHPGWTGTYDAMSYGPAAPQPDTRLEAQTEVRERWSDLLHPRTGNGSEGSPTGDDCANLNVWTPTSGHGSKLPVVVWLHGGSFHSGSTAAVATQGTALARDGQVVVVSVGHRLGVFGCARLDLLDGDRFPDAGVLGQLDIILGLEWIQQNIAQFNGDPENVTLMGQSGGGMKITTLLGMPATRGLFHRAINCSGPGATVQTRDDGAQAAELLVRAAAVQSVEQLANLSTAALIEAGLEATRLDAAEYSGALGTAAGPKRGMMMFAPGIHARHLPEQPMTSEGLKTVPWADDIPMMFGYTTHEATLFLSNVPGAMEWDEEVSAQALRRHYPDDADDILGRYEEHYGSERPHLRLARILSDSTFRTGQRRLALDRSESSAPAYIFHFDYEPQVLDGVLGATHGMDVPFIFGTVDRSPMAGDSSDRFDISRAMVSAVSTFAHDGEPSVPGGPVWKAATVETPHTMVFGDDIRDIDASIDDGVVVWGEW